MTVALSSPAATNSTDTAANEDVSPGLRCQPSLRSIRRSESPLASASITLRLRDLSNPEKLCALII